MQVHSIIHIPEIIILFGPISGFVWTLSEERWMLKMKDFVTTTIGFSTNIIKNYQLYAATVKLWYVDQVNLDHLADHRWQVSLSRPVQIVDTQ